MIAEGKVLLGIEDFQQSRRRIAAVVGADLVDFVEHEHRVRCRRLIDGLDDPAGQRTDVRATVTADFRFVAHAA